PDDLHDPETYQHIPTSSDVDHTSSPVPQSRGTKTRVRITNRNAVYGTVEWAKRGAKSMGMSPVAPRHAQQRTGAVIPRMWALKEPITSQSKSSCRFLRLVTDILERCEQVSQETGCWLFFSAQHMFAKVPFLHYASPRIRKEGRKEVEEITNHFNRLFLSLIAARNQDSKEMHKKLLDAQAKEASAQRQLEEARAVQEETAIQAASVQRALELQEAQMQATKAKLEMYKAKLRVAGMS
ncbi:hypothetical protein DFH09DRAFT_931165, partial [Mycena vulgaris]